MFLFALQTYKEPFSRQMDLISAHWEEDQYRQQYYSLLEHHYDIYYRYLAREAMDSGYPVDFGTVENLNEKGRSLIDSSVAGDKHHFELDEDSPDAAWRTFRDGDPSTCISIFTGAGAVPLKCPWLELESCETVADVVDLTAAKEVIALQSHTCAHFPANSDEENEPQAQQNGLPAKPTWTVTGADNETCRQTNSVAIAEDMTKIMKDNSRLMESALNTEGGFSALNGQSSSEVQDDVMVEDILVCR